LLQLQYQIFPLLSHSTWMPYARLLNGA
jgi:hypothetical protein